MNRINEVCTKQLDDQPAILLLPFEHSVHIQYPSNEQPGTKLRGRLLTGKLVDALKKTDSHSQNPASSQITSAATLNSERFDHRLWDHFHLSAPHWSHRNPDMKFEELDDHMVGVIRQKCENQLKIILPELPVYYGTRIPELVQPKLTLSEWLLRKFCLASLTVA
ncbi:hypothetical protein PtB15_10B54 [Puccinia triticina]|nr:hypothetical protein PtB15_10B54 [Puccinia triticina]